MKDSIITTYYRLLDEVTTDYHRYLYDCFDVQQRLVGIVGARGTGKTTLMLQYIKEKIENIDQALYFSADHIYFAQNSLFEFVQEQFEHAGRTIFFVDEVHKYPRWNREIKNIYDSFPKIHLVFSGSSSVDLVKGSYDLSRRALLHRLEGLSFREFLLFDKGLNLPALSLKKLLESHQRSARKIAQLTGLKGLFSEYLTSGYYPFYFEDKTHFAQRLLTIIEKTIYEDVASHYNLRTGHLPLLKKILLFYATSQPGDLNINTLSKGLGIDNKTVSSYLEMLRTTSLLLEVGVDKSGGAMIRKPKKILLGNPNLYQSLCREIGRECPIGTVRESFFLSMLKSAQGQVFYRTQGDYSHQGVTYEIGGKNKSAKQLKNAEGESYLVKDDILIGDNPRSIPLYLFGFLY